MLRFMNLVEDMNLQFMQTKTVEFNQDIFKRFLNKLSYKFDPSTPVVPVSSTNRGRDRHRPSI